jgi:hypothetical protein
MASSASSRVRAAQPSRWKYSDLRRAAGAATVAAVMMGLNGTAAAEPVPVELRRQETGWQLFRGGEPYFIRGAGGTASLAALAAAGANSVRTWGGDPGPVLDEAHSLGLTVTVGLWLGHERHGFDYSSQSQIRKQLDDARAIVERYKDHPALLLWGVGNEMEGFEDGDDPAIWRAVNDVAAMVKAVDPHHPTMTVTAFVHGDRIEYLHHKSPAIDIHGVNAYGGAQVVPEMMRAGGATKPFVLTEFGPIGPWEAHKTAWGAPFEPTSSEKAAFYRESYEKAVLGAPDIALGAYAFLWGHKTEGTDTWFGMFLPDGARTAAVNVMTELWSGRAPANRAPSMAPLQAKTSMRADPGQVVNIRADLHDPERGDLRVEWLLRPEAGEYLTGGDYRPTLPAIEDAIIDADSRGARVRMPDRPGAYRVFLYAYDDAGNAATANLPLLVNGEPQTPLPFPVYIDSLEGMPWVPSGWMGGTDKLSLDGTNTEDPHSGQASIKIRYEGTFGWAAVAWQNPPDNWGDLDGGYDLEGARSLELWARGQYGGEKVSFGVGLLDKSTLHPDSAITKVEGILLTSEWRRYRVPLRRLDLSSIKTGFVVALTGRATPVTVYLDDIRFVR